MAKTVKVEVINERGHVTLRDEHSNSIDWIEETLYKQVEVNNFVAEFSRSCMSQNSYEYN